MRFGPSYYPITTASKFLGEGIYPPVTNSCPWFTRIFIQVPKAWLLEIPLVNSPGPELVQGRPRYSPETFSGSAAAELLKFSLTDHSARRILQLLIP
jgi:hypothetical protein